MNKEDIRGNIVERVNEAARSLCCGGDYTGKEICVRLPIPFDISLFDCTDTSGIQLDNVKIEVEGPSCWVPPELQGMPFHLLRVTGTVPGKWENTIKEIHGRRWYCCPYCGKALFPVSGDTRITALRYRCKACKHDIEVNI